MNNASENEQRQPGTWEDMRIALGAIHYFALRPSSDKVELLSAMATIRDECERQIPELEWLRPEKMFIEAKSTVGRRQTMKQTDKKDDGNRKVKPLVGWQIESIATMLIFGLIVCFAPGYWKWMSVLCLGNINCPRQKSDHEK